MSPLSIVPDADTPRCGYPLSLERTCPRPVDMTGYQGGQKPGYCNDPQHTRDTAFRRRQTLQRDAQKAAEQEPEPRPVTQGVAKLSTLLKGLQQIKSEIAAMLEESADTARIINDPSALAYEVDQIKRDAEEAVRRAERARASAEHAAAVAIEQRDKAHALAADATATAEAAIQDREAARSQARDAISHARQELRVANDAAHVARERAANYDEIKRERDEWRDAYNQLIHGARS